MFSAIITTSKNIIFGFRLSCAYRPGAAQILPLNRSCASFLDYFRLNRFDQLPSHYVIETRWWRQCLAQRQELREVCLQLRWQQCCTVGHERDEDTPATGTAAAWQMLADHLIRKILELDFLDK